MHRRHWLANASLFTLAGLTGCRGYQYAHIIKGDKPNMVGSHSAGAEVFDPLVEESVTKLLAREHELVGDCPIGPDGLPMRKRIYFVGIENKSAEEIGDFKDQLYQLIDTKILESDLFAPLSSHMVEAALRETRLRPDSLFVPDNLMLFTSILQRDGAPIDYLLRATITSGTTKRNSSSQRDYLMTLELTNLHTGVYSKQSAEVRKGYHKTAMGGLWNYGPFKR